MVTNREKKLGLGVRQGTSVEFFYIGSSYFCKRFCLVQSLSNTFFFFFFFFFFVGCSPGKLVVCFRQTLMIGIFFLC